MSELLPWMSPLLAAWCLTACLAGMRWFSARSPRGHGRSSPEPVPDDGFELGRTPAAAEPLDIKTVLGTVLRHLERDAARLLTQVRLSAREDLLVHADGRALGAALRLLIRNALELSPCAAVLVTARRHGGRIEVSVLADGCAESEAALRASLREAESTFALLGGTLEVDARPDGAVMRVRLPEFVGRSAEPAAEKRAEPVQASRVRQLPLEAEVRAIT